MTPREAADRLAGSTAPLLIGVRHHSPAVSAIVARTLDAFQPTRVLIELPAELESWLAWLAHDKARSPLALAATVQSNASDLAFYPFADFSPELVAIRWAHQHAVPVEACDLPVAERIPRDKQRRATGAAPSILEAIEKREGADGFEELWDRMVEARAAGQPPEAIRRAALVLGWMLRFDEVQAGGVSAYDLRRESYMRSRVRAALEPAGARVAAVIGAFHASALLDPPLLCAVPDFKPNARKEKVTTALLPYSFPLLDSRSGYPAGIRDPAWQQRVVGALSKGTSIEHEAFEAIAQVARLVRGSRHVASFPDAREAARLSLDLARMRGLGAPSRRELLEGIESAMCHGETLGRGRVIARALSKVLVGERRGALAEGTPRSGLSVHLEDLFQELGLPSADAPRKELRLDPLRSALDRRRETTLERLCAAQITYAERLISGPTAAAIDALGSRWALDFTPATSATIEVAGCFGVTLIDAARGRLRERRSKAEANGARVSACEIETLALAARAGITDLVVACAQRLASGALADATFSDLVAAHALLAKIALGHVPALPTDAASATHEVAVFTADLSGPEAATVEALIASLDGLAGSSSHDDVLALRDLLDLPARAKLGASRLHATIDRLAREGSPLMQGAAAVLAHFLGRGEGAAGSPGSARRESPSLGEPDLSAMLESFVSAPADRGAERSARLRGVLLVGIPALETEPSFSQGLVLAVARLTDPDFLARLPSLRDGFEVLSPRARDRLLEALLVHTTAGAGSASAAALELDPERMAAFAEADQAARGALEQLGLELEARPLPASDTAGPKTGDFEARGSISARDRLRLMLGRQRASLTGSSARASAALERLYGRGEGEGSSDPDEGAGTGSSFPSVRSWSDEIEALFGEGVREEVLGRAALRGDVGAALELDARSVRPSIELLEQILSLKGGLAEADLGRLRVLVGVIVEQLVAELATRVRPALSGLVTPRRTSRPGGPVDLRRTIQRNLKSARPDGSGAITLTPERLVFRERQKRSLDWHVILVVDVSGSMEPSVLYSALMAAILSAMPALTVRFIAFNDRVVDLSHHATDPLTLLLEIAIGGGTLIGDALVYARSLVRVPSRTLLLVVSDFEDGGAPGLLTSEVRALVESGVRPLGLAALDERGAPRYAKSVAEMLVAAGMPVAALSPLELARWIAEQIR